MRPVSQRCRLCPTDVSTTMLHEGQVRDPPPLRSNRTIPICLLLQACSSSSCLCCIAEGKVNNGNEDKGWSATDGHPEPVRSLVHLFGRAHAKSCEASGVSGQVQKRKGAWCKKQGWPRSCHSLKPYGPSLVAFPFPSPKDGR